MKTVIDTIQWHDMEKDKKLALLDETRFRDIVKMRPNLSWEHYEGKIHCYVTWVDHLGKLMEWHPDDALRFRDAFIWYLCQSPNYYLKRLGWKMWCNP